MQKQNSKLTPLVALVGGDDTRVARESNDVLSGGGGNDLLIAGAGDDYILGGEGDDLCSIRTRWRDAANHLCGEPNRRAA